MSESLLLPGSPLVIGSRASINEAMRAIDRSMIVVDLCGVVAPDLDSLRAEITTAATVIVVSAAGADRAATRYTELIGERERAARALVPHAVTIRTAPVVDDLEVYVDSAALGIPAHHAYGPHAAPWVSAADVADVAAAAAAAIDAGHDARRGQAVLVTGERPCTPTQLLEAMGVAPIAVDPQDLVDGLLAAGYDSDIVEVVATHQIWAGAPCDVSGTVRAALGRGPLDPLAHAATRAATPGRRA